MRFYVYDLIDPRDGKVFYVGKGTGNRIDQHEREARAGRVSRKCDRIRDIEAEGLSVIKKRVRSFADEQDAFDFEADRIDEIGLHNLTNVAPGGGIARGAPTLRGDRANVRAIASIVNKTRNGRITISVAGKVIDMLPILRKYDDAVAEVASRRGIEWVNAISKRVGVEYVHGGA